MENWLIWLMKFDPLVIHKAIEHVPVEIVNFHLWHMGGISRSLCKHLPGRVYPILIPFFTIVNPLLNHEKSPFIVYVTNYQRVSPTKASNQWHPPGWSFVDPVVGQADMALLGTTLLENGYLTTINGDFSWFNNGLTMVKNGMIIGYTLWLWLLQFAMGLSHGPNRNRWFIYRS